MKVNYTEMRKKSAKFFMNYLSHVFSSQLWNNNNGLKRFRFFYISEITFVDKKTKKCIFAQIEEWNSIK